MARNLALDGAVAYGDSGSMVRLGDTGGDDDDARLGDARVQEAFLFFVVVGRPRGSAKPKPTMLLGRGNGRGD